MNGGGVRRCTETADGEPNARIAFLFVNAPGLETADDEEEKEEYYGGGGGWEVFPKVVRGVAACVWFDDNHFGDKVARKWKTKK